jgi:NitT/TauT family transport system substrate-binding protein
MVKRHMSVPAFCTMLAMALLLSAGGARAADPAPIEVALGDVSLNKVAFLVAGDNGIYGKNGLVVHQFITPSAAERIRRSGVDVPPEFVKSGRSDDAQISIGGGSPLIVAMTSDARATERVIVATTDSTARFHIISNTALNSVEDLKGKRLGYSSYGAVSHLMALVFLKKMGWDPREDISLYGEGMAYEALKKGRVDAFIGSEIYYSMAAKNGAKDLVDLAKYDIAIAGSGINVERKWLEANRDTVARFVKATIDAYALLKTNKQVAFAAMAKWYKVTDPAQQEQMYAQVADMPRKPYPAVEGIKQVLQVYDYRELRKRKPEDFYDSSFVAELDKSGYIDKLYTN